MHSRETFTFQPGMDAERLQNALDRLLISALSKGDLAESNIALALEEVKDPGRDENPFRLHIGVDHSISRAQIQSLEAFLSGQIRGVDIDSGQVSSLSALKQAGYGYVAENRVRPPTIGGDFNHPIAGYDYGD